MGSEYAIPKGAKDLAFFVNNEDGIVYLALKKEQISFVRLDAKSLTPSAENTIAVEESSKHFVSETAIALNKNYYWLHSDWDNESEMEYLYYDKLDVQSGKMSMTNKKILETTKIADDNPKVYGFARHIASDKYAFYFDKAKKKLLVTYRLNPLTKKPKNNYDKIGLAVFDEQMNKLWGGEYTMLHTEAVMEKVDFAVDSLGNAYLLAKVYNNDSKNGVDKATGDPAYHYEVLKFTKNNKQFITGLLSQGDQYIKRPTLVENNLHEMIFAGNYSKKAKGYGTDGIYLAVLNQQNKIVPYRKGNYEFPLEELKKFETTKSLQKQEKARNIGLDKFDIRDIVIESDGGIFITCEEFYILSSQRTSNATGNLIISEDHYYENILALKITTSGNMAWLRKLPKRQVGYPGRSMMSFALFTANSGYYFLYLDNIHNLNLPENELPKYHIDGAGGQLMVYGLDHAGKVTKDLLFDTREEDLRVFPAEFERLNDNQYIERTRVKGSIKYKLLMLTVQ